MDTTVNRLVDIAVTKTARPATVLAGSGARNLVYTLTATNEGVSNATNVKVSDPGVLRANRPASVWFSSASGSNGSTFNPRTGIWNVGDLDVGATRTLRIRLTVGANAADGLSISNTASLASVTETESNLLNNSQSTTTAVVRAIDLVVVKTGSPDPVLSPGQITYTVVVTNRGVSRAGGIVLIDTPGPWMTFASGSSTQGRVSHRNGIVRANIGALAPGDSATMTLIADVSVETSGVLLNTATATANENELNPDDNTSSIETQVIQTRASVSGVVYQDLNSDGIRDPGEPLLSGVQVVLFGIDEQGNTVIRPTRTDDNGAYSFTNLVPGNYNVYEIQPGILLDGNEIPGTGATSTVANDAFLQMALGLGANATAFDFTEGLEDPSKRPFLSSAQKVGETLIVSLPMTGAGSLSGRVATDSNRSGTLDNGDVGIPGAIVTLAGFDTAGNPVLIHQSTDFLGRFSFVNLPEGEFSLIETQLKGRSDGAEQAGDILPNEVLDNIFSGIALPGNTAGTGYNFLELPAAGTSTKIPTLLTPTTGNTGPRPTITWTAVASAAHYDLWVNQITGNVGVVYRNQNVSGTSMTLPTDLNPGEHRVWVRSVNSWGVPSPWSQPLAFTVAAQGAAIPARSASRNTNPTPARPTLTSVAVSTGGTPTFNWITSSGAVRYELRVNQLGGPSKVIHQTAVATNTFRAISLLQAGRYRAWVRAFDKSGTASQWSLAFDFRVL